MKSAKKLMALCIILAMGSAVFATAIYRENTQNILQPWTGTGMEMPMLLPSSGSVQVSLLSIVPASAGDPLLVMYMGDVYEWRDDCDGFWIYYYNGDVICWNTAQNRWEDAGGDPILGEVLSYSGDRSTGGDDDVM